MPADTAPGCRDTAIATTLFLVAAAALVAVGLGMINRQGCTGLCETIGLASLYAGGPISAVLGVLFGGLHLAWPLDVTFWVTAGFVIARRSHGVVTAAVLLILVAVVYGLVLSQFVELDLAG